jgi:hypothetical protein
VPEPIAKWNSQRDVWERTETPIFGPLDVYSETFPTSGMTVNGVAYELPTWEHHMDGSESLSLLLTPVASEGTKPYNTMGVARREATGQAFLTNQIVTLMGLDPSEQLLPTPSAYDAEKGGSQHPDKRRLVGGHQPSIMDVAEHLLTGDPSSQLYGDGKDSSDDLHRDQLSLLDEVEPNDSAHASLNG